MRITIEFIFADRLILPVNYGHILQAFLLNHLSDRDYRQFIHDVGYRAGEKRFKMYTFSRLLGRYEVLPARKEIAFESPVSLVISAAVDPFITDLAETLIKTEACRLGANQVEIRSITVHRAPQFAGEVTIRMLSPMTAYTTRNEGDSRKTDYYSPWKEDFAPVLYFNLLSKYEALHGNKPPAHDFQLCPTGKQEQRMKTITTYKGTIIEAYQGIYILKAHPDLIAVAYDAGLGGKNAQGFGCWEEVRE